MKKILRGVFVSMVRFFSFGLDLSRFGVVRKIYNFFYSLVSEKDFNKPVKINVAGVGSFSMYLDEKDSLRLGVFGSYEEFEVQTILKLIKPGFKVFDLGANIGYYTIIFSLLVGDSGSVYAFEPDPKNFSILKKNIELNGCKNVILEQVAVCDSNGGVDLYLNEENRGDHRIFSSDNNQIKIPVKSLSLDNYLQSHNLVSVDFIKMDIQGSEAKAFRGMSKVLDGGNIKIAFEFWPSAIKLSGERPDFVVDFLKQKGFRLLEIDSKRKSVEPWAPDLAIEKNKDWDANILAVKETI